MADVASQQPDALGALAHTLYGLDQAHRRFRSVTARLGALTGIELTGLLAVASAPGIRPGSLAQDLGISTGATTALVDRLETSGHIRRVTHRHDRRSLELQLTDAGRDTVLSMSDTYQAVLGDAQIGHDASAIIESLERISAALNDAARTSSS